jgi:hypothetical protein
MAINLGKLPIYVSLGEGARMQIGEIEVGADYDADADVVTVRRPEVATVLRDAADELDPHCGADDAADAELDRLLERTSASALKSLDEAIDVEQRLRDLHREAAASRIVLIHPDDVLVFGNIGDFDPDVIKNIGKELREDLGIKRVMFFEDDVDVTVVRAQADEPSL